ncbi:L-methionine transporter [Athelia psychrophila]|uniref:L-methionine transporter n=1 Tax=Athelia psychrophila TaxID=1759441 RepID=A0A166I1H2_9AGAM|nr:L-methionine transporter [Fibularhizoctonia sp. CBS 109695]
MVKSQEDSYTSLNSPSHYPPSRLSHHSNDSNDSLRALEYSEGPVLAESSRHARDRSYSFSGFDFQQALLPLSASLDEPENTHGDAPEKNIGLIHGVALIVGLQIGSGIFSSPGVVVANTKSVGAALVVWLAAGLLAWTGASSFAELGTAIPLNGGPQAYLAYAYGPLASYLYAFTAILAIKPGSNAVVALIFAEYINRILWHATQSNISPDAVPQWAIKLTAVLAVYVVTALCAFSRNTGARAAIAFTTVKVLALISIVIIGVVQLARGKTSTSLTEPIFEDSSTSPSSYALALYSGLWAVDGWDQANYVGGEIKNSNKNLPRAIHSSMLLVITLFLLANISYFVVLDQATIARSNTVAMDFGRALFGPVGGIIFAFMVAFSCFGALNGSTYTSARLICVAGRERYLPAMFGRLHKTRKTPLNAMLLQAALTTIFIVVGGGFRSLINFSVMVSWTFYFLTVLGLIVLRFNEPTLERPYKTWIITPLTFCAVALFLICMPVLAAPLEAIAALGFVLAGIPVYYMTSRSDTKSTPPLIAFFGSIWARIRGQPSAEDGWVAVATDGDDQVEMVEGPSTSTSLR